MYLAGGGLDAEHAQGQVATVAIEAMRFLQPISVGDEASCYCALVKIGDTSGVWKVETWARGRGQGKEPQKVTEGVFIFVAIYEGGHSRSLT